MANKFTNFKFTTEGKDTLTEVLAAKGSIAITQVYTFATKLTDTLVFTQLSSLGPKQIKPVGTVSAQSNTVETRLQIDNADLTSDYNLQGIALVGTFNKTNFVLGYINTNEATNVPAFSGNQVQTISLDVSFAISDTSVITINTQTAGMLTVADYNALVAYIKDQVAPLSVDKKVVHLTNNEIIDGIKTFKQKITGSISGNANTVDYININQITANIDLNTLTTNGNYLSTLETKTTSNKPGGTSEQYTLISTGNIQVFNDIKTDKTYIRNYIKSDTFTSWKVVIEDIDQTLNAQFNFTKVPTVNSKPVAIQADLLTETTNRTNADKTINNSLATEVSDRKSGDTINANAIQAEATARSQADSSAAAALNTEKTTRSAADTSLSNNLASEASARSAADVGLTNQFNTVNSGLNSESVTRSAADATLAKSVTDTQKKVQTETTNRTNADNKIDSATVHKTGNETLAGTKTFSSAINGNLSGNASTADKLRTARTIGGVKFDGTANINLPGVNTQGNQNTTGNAATTDVLNVRSCTFTDISVVTADMIKYSGNWEFNSSNVNGIPSIGYVVMEVLPSGGNKTAGIIRISSTSFGVTANYIGLVRNGSQLSWVLLPDDSTVVHKSGDTMTGGLKGGQTNLPASGDLNTLTDTGKYYQTTSVNTAKWLNRPSNAPSLAFSVDVIGQANKSLTTQVYYVHTTSRMWIRTMWLDGSMKTSAWTELADDSTVVHNSGNETIGGSKTFSSTINGNLNGNSTTSTKLATARTIGGVSFDGTQNINLPGVNTQGNQDTTGNASTADKLHTARTIGGVSFNGGSNINLPGVNTQGNQNTTGNAASATKLQVARKVNGTAFDGTKDISINAANDSNIVHQSGNESIAGNKTFNNKLTVNNTAEANYWYKNITNKKGNPILEIDDTSDDTPFLRAIGYYYSGDSNGSGITVGAGGLTVVGGGESARTITESISNQTNNTTSLPINAVNDEHVVISADGYIYFMPGQQSGINYGPMFRFSSNGYLDKWNGASWIPIIDKNATLLASDNTVVHNSGNENITGTKTFSSTISGSVSGNAGSADKLKTARKINGVNFNGTGDINVKASNDSDIVHKSSNETIGGNKTFTGTLTAGGTKLTDSGWKNLSSPSGAVKYRILNGVVHISVLSAKEGIGKTIATLPVGARPGQDVWTPYYSAGISGNYKIQPDGKIYRASESSSFNGGEVSIWAAFPADN